MKTGWEKEIKRIRLSAEKRAWLNKIFSEREYIAELRKQTKEEEKHGRNVINH